MFHLSIVKQIPSIFNCSNILIKQFSSSAVRLVGLKWRKAHGYPDNYTSRGILTDGPDFSYMDGRPTPYTTGQRARILRQKEYAEKVKYLLSVTEKSKKAYQEKIAAHQKQREKVLGRKLKPKGKNLEQNRS